MNAALVSIRDLKMIRRKKRTDPKILNGSVHAIAMNYELLMVLERLREGPQNWHHEH